MTTLVSKKITCGICGHLSEHNVMASTSAFGASDLDFRSPSPARWTTPWWLRECPGCGYAAQSLDRAGNEEAEIVASDEYKALQSQPHSPPLIRSFLLAALIAEKMENFKAAANYNLWAAWVFDDSKYKNKDAARLFRSKAADLYFSVRPDRDVETESARIFILRNIDILRRAHRWNEAIDLATSFMVRGDATPDGLKVAEFQISLSKKQDDDCYTTTCEPRRKAVNKCLSNEEFWACVILRDVIKTFTLNIRALIQRGLKLFR